MATPGKYEIRLDDQLEAHKEKQPGVTWPYPVDVRLDQLVEAARGDRTTRKELVAALVCAAPVDAGWLSEVIRRYRGLQARDVIIGAGDDQTVLAIDRARPGPRPSRSA